MKIPKKVDVCGITYRVVFIGPKRMQKESGYKRGYGCVDQDKAIIYLAKSSRNNPTLLRDSLVHEIVGHALWHASGLGYWLETRIKPKTNFFKFQETFVRWHTPAVITTLRAMGLLKD